jgi:ferritin-like metal-binding protein YciE
MFRQEISRNISLRYVEREGDMENTIQAKLVSYLRDAHAMESNVLKMLDSMIQTTSDEQVGAQLRKHRTETERHQQLVAERLTALGEDTSTLKDVSAQVGAMFKGMADAARGDKAGKNARDGYVTEAMEIAAYKLLEQLALRAGDEATAELARRICRDEENMRAAIESDWGRFIDLTLQEEGIEAGAR